MSTSNVNADSTVKDLDGMDMDKKLHDDAATLMTCSGLCLNRESLFQEPQFFPLDKLPPEIRNKIYRMVLVTGFLDVPITDMHYDEYHESGDTTALRTSYWTISHDDEEDSPPTNPNGTWTREDHTTYTSPIQFSADHIPSATCALLSLNHATRLESIPIFYGENRFTFATEGCIVPFLQDRTPFARTSIRHIRLLLLLEDDGSNAARQRTWVKNFTYIAANLPRLSTLSLRIIDSEGRMLGGTSDFALPPVIGGRWMKWVRPLMQITNLQRFGLEIEIGMFGAYNRGSATRRWERYAVNKWLSFFEPRMLARGARRTYVVPRGSEGFGVRDPPRGYVWESEEDSDAEDEDYEADADGADDEVFVDYGGMGGDMMEVSGDGDA